MIFHKSSQSEVSSNKQITDGNTTLKEAIVVKYVGVKFGSGLEFHEKFKNILGKMAVTIRTLSIIAQKLPHMTSRLVLQEYLVMSHLNRSE